MTKESATVIQISRKGLMIWIGLIIFIALWMFVLGILVGRGTAPVNLEAGKLEKELTELKARMVEKEQEKVEGKGEEKAELGFYEALKDPGKAESFKSVKPAPAPKAKAPAKTKSSTFESRPVTPARKVPAAVPKPAPAPEPKVGPGPEVGAAAGKARFSVQVASVQESGGAEKLVTGLRKKGYEAYQIRSQVPGKGVWYRVRVGAFGDRGAAEKMLKKLKSENYGGMVVHTQ